MVRIAAVQIDYQPAFYSDATGDYLSAPLTEPLGPLAFRYRTLGNWRDELKEEYARAHGKKLNSIVRFCKSQGVEIVVFPEYSVPASCLPELLEISKKNSISIVAGSHRVRENDPVYQDVGLKDFPVSGTAICPIVRNGSFDYIHKCIASKYDQEVDPQAHGVQRPKWAPQYFDVEEGLLLTKVFVCSDYLNLRARIKQSDTEGQIQASRVNIVVSFTPALGQFVAPSIEALQTAQLGAYDDSANFGVVVFVNGAERGGTKVFFQNRNVKKILLEENDGTIGSVSITDRKVRTCGVESKIEAVVIADVPIGEIDGVPRQVAICPIVHCGGPRDIFVDKWMLFRKELQGISGISETRKFFRENQDRYRKLVLNSGNSLVRTKSEHLLGNLDVYEFEEDLKSMADSVCIIHEEAPHVDVWQFRAALSTKGVLRGLNTTSTYEFKNDVDALIRNCDETIEAGLSGSKLSDGERLFVDDVIALSPRDRLRASGAFYEEILSERSSTRANKNTAEWFLHLWNGGAKDDLNDLVEEIRRHREIPLVALLQDVKALISNNPDSVAAFLKTKISTWEHARQELRTVARKAVKDWNPDDAIIAFGYSEAVIALLEEVANERSRKLPHVVVCEVRNRAYTREGERFAQILRTEFEFPTVFFVTEASLHHVLQSEKLNVKRIMMGFKITSDEGVVNTVGSRVIAELAHNLDKEVWFVGYSTDYWNEPLWNEFRERINVEGKKGAWLEPNTRQGFKREGIDYASYDVASDIVPWKLVTMILTDRGCLEPQDFRRSMCE